MVGRGKPHKKIRDGKTELKDTIRGEAMLVMV